MFRCRRSTRTPADQHARHSPGTVHPTTDISHTQVQFSLIEDRGPTDRFHSKTLTLTLTITLTFDLGLQSHQSYGHDPYTCKKSRCRTQRGLCVCVLGTTFSCAKTADRSSVDPCGSKRGFLHKEKGDFRRGHKPVHVEAEMTGSVDIAYLRMSACIRLLPALCIFRPRLAHLPATASGSDTRRYFENSLLCFLVIIPNIHSSSTESTL